MGKLHPLIKSVSSSNHSTSEIVRWGRDGDQWVATINGKETRITEISGPLGSMFSVYVDKKNIASAGGGTKADALARAKLMAEQHARKAVTP